MATMSLKKAALINAASKYTSILLGIVFTMILARILTPEDYGIVAVTTVFTNFFGIFADMGISTGIIQYKQLTKEDNASIFSLTMLLGLILGVLFCGFSFFIADFYRNDVYIPIGFMLGFNLFGSTLNIVPEALLLKDKRFIMLAKRNVIIPFFTSLVTVGLAFCGWKYYALVMQSILAVWITFVVNLYTTHKDYGLYLYRGVTWQGMGKIFGYSLYQFLFGLVNYFARNLDNLLVGKYFGAAALGYYDKAYKLMSYPVGNLTHVITPVLQPILSDFQDDKRRVYEKYMRLVKLLSLAGVYIVSICYFMGDEIIYVMFGNQWMPTVPYFKLLALSVWAQMILGTTGSIFQSAGDTRRLFITGTVGSFFAIMAIVAGIMSGSLLHVAQNVMLFYNANFFFAMYMLIHLSLKQPYWRFLKNFWPEVVMAFAIWGIGKWATLFFAESQFLVQVFGKGIIFTIAFVLLCFILRQWKYLWIFRR